MKVRKAIIPAAGLGTRFLPATKAMPKEMLPIVDKPTIEYVVDEAIASGIEDILIVTGQGKRAIEDHFDTNLALEQRLESSGKQDLLEAVRKSGKVDIHYIRQKEPLGLGHAIHRAKNFIGNEPFGVLLGDDIIQSETPCLRQLMDVFEREGGCTIAVKEVPHDEVDRYGIVDSTRLRENVSLINQLVEKPVPSEAPSNLAIMGRYVLTPRIFEWIEQVKPGKNGEIQLTDALNLLAQDETAYACCFEGKRYDVGERLGFITTTIDFALQRQDLRDPLITFLKEIAARF